MLIAEINWEYVMPATVFGAFAAAAWLFLELVVARRPRAEERLEQIRHPRPRRDQVRAARKQDAMTRMLERASPALARPLTPKNEADAGRLKTRLANAGFRGESAATIFLGLKIAALVAGFFLSGGGMVLAHGLTQKALIWTIVCAGTLFYLPDLVVAVLKKRRQQAIFVGLPDTLDLMVVCVEAGLALDQAMRKVCDEMSKAHPIIAEEFNLANFQLQMGRARAEVLRELAQRTGVEDLKILAGILIQADKFGSSISQALRVQSDSMRIRRRQIAEEKAAKTAVKLLFPLVLFIFPGIFVVLVGPAAISWINQMAPRMTGE